MDAADQEKIEASKNELHNLLDKPQLQGIPVSRWSGWERERARSHWGRWPQAGMLHALVLTLFGFSSE